jgi:microcystin-dependent protein
MGVTATYQLPYPDGPDPADVPTDMHELADAVDAALGAVAPTGVLLPFAADAAPSGWLICDGTALSRTTYARLFAVIGTAYGSGDGTATFNLPDLRGRVPVGKGSHADVSTLGNNDGVAAASRSPRHNSTHNLTLPDHQHNLQLGQGGGFITITGNSTGPAPIITTGSVTSFPAINGSVGPGGARPVDTPAYVVTNYIIKT